MCEEDNLKWEKVTDRAARRDARRGGRYSREGEESRFQEPRHHSDRRAGYEDHGYSSRHRYKKIISPRRQASHRSEEDGEILLRHPVLRDGSSGTIVVNKEKTNMSPKQLETPQVKMVPEKPENGLELVNEILEDSNTLLDEEKMAVDENMVELGEMVDSKELDAGFQDLSKGEFNVSKETESAEMGELKEEKEGEQAAGRDDGPRKQGTRKIPSKLGLGTEGNTKKLLVQALLSPRKRTQPKVSSKGIEGGKQDEEKGPSHSLQRNKKT